MKNIIEVNSLVKEYDNFKLGEINLEIPSGSIVGLIGENGAGKTTLIKTILNIVKSTSGSIKIFNKDISEYEDLIKEDIAVVLDDAFFPEILNSNDINNIMKNIYKKWDRDLFYKYLNEFNISSSISIKHLSKGMRKKLELATALSHHPKLLILDEVTSGLDPVVRNEILDIFLDFIQNEECSILLSTHITSDLERIADKIVFINNGKIVLDINRDNLLDNYGILKCSIKEFSNINKKDIITYKKNRYNYEILIDNKDKIKKKYKDYIVDKINLDDLMLLIIKGDK